MYGGGCAEAGLPHAALVGTARQVLSTAAAALPRSLPFLWRSVRDVSREAEAVVLLNSGFLNDQVPSAVDLIDGESLGLSLVMSLASRVLSLPLPANVAASGKIDGAGNLFPVSGLDLKVRCLRRCAPSIDTLIVHVGNESEARTASEGTLTIIGVLNVADALTAAWNRPREAGELRDVLEQHLCGLGKDEATQTELADALFRLALEDRGASISWAPIARTAELAISNWSPKPQMLQRLEFARNVALRHDLNLGTLELPSDDFLSQMPFPHRAKYCAHVVQQAADSGTPNWQAAEVFALKMLDGNRGLDASPGHLRLLGALGRLYAFRGRFEEAIALQNEAALEWMVQGEYQEVSYPVSELYRLSGATENRDLFEQTEDLARRAGLAGPYTELGQASALAALGGIVKVEAFLRKFALDSGQIGFLRWKALRVLLQFSALPLSDLEGPNLALSQATHGTGNVAKSARVVAALLGLDRALKAGSAAESAAALDAFVDMAPFPAGHLIAAAKGFGVDPAGFVARYYPY